MPLFNTGMGIDISDHHVRFARVAHSGTPTSLLEIKIPHGFIVDDIVVKPKTLKKDLSKRMGEAGLLEVKDKATILIPESRVFSTSFMIEKSFKGEEFVSQAMSLAQKEIPIPFSDCFVDVHKGKRINSDYRVSVIAVEKSVISGLAETFNDPFLSTEIMESNNASLHRVYREYHKKEFTLPSENDLVMIVDIGHRWSNLTLYDILSASVFSRSIALRELSDTSRGIVKTLSKEMIVKICEKIKQTLEAFQAKNQRIPLVIVAGVEGAQEQTCQYCTKVIKNSLVKRLGEVVEIPGISLEDIHVYGAAIGAGLRSAKARSFTKEHKITLT